MGARGSQRAADYILILSYLLMVTCFLAVDGDYLEEGDPCGDGQRWKCQKLSLCVTGQNDLKAGNPPEICSFEVCEKYAQYVFRKEQAPILSFDTPTVTVNECGRIEEPLIVGGKSAKLKEFPHMAQIGYGEKARIAWLCGGSLISERYVLSAAHCTHPNGKGPAKWVRLGDLDTSNDNEGPPPEIVRITERTNHPDYNQVELYNDIALYKLQKEVTFTPFIRPICLQVEHSIPQDVTIATGWGHTQWTAKTPTYSDWVELDYAYIRNSNNHNSGGRPSSILQKVSLDLVPARACNDSYRENIGRQLPNGILDSKMICAGKDEGKDTCQGDSGGPLQIPLRKPYCMYAQVGVTSFGRACAENHPGVYTRISYYVPWIESVVWPGQ